MRAIIATLALVFAASGETLRPQLPTGVVLDPAGRSTAVGGFPLAMVPAPGGERLVLSTSGWREQGLQVVDRGSGAVVQTLSRPGAFLGLAFSADGRTLYASGGDADAIDRYDWKDGVATLGEPIVLAPKAPKKDPTRYPAGLALARDGRHLYVAENVADTLAVLALPEGRVAQRLPTGHYPLTVVVGPSGVAYVSAWGESHVAVFDPDAGGRLRETARIPVGRHPSALALNADGSRLFAACASVDSVAVIDTHARRVIATLADPPPSGPQEGSTPNGLALAPDGTRLYVAEADDNAVAVFRLSARTSGIKTARGDDRLAGRIPVGWYPTALLASADELLVLNGKGDGSVPSPAMVQGTERLVQGSPDYTLGLLHGTLSAVPTAALADLAGLTTRVAHANGWDRPRAKPSYPPLEHVVYIIKENRTYDQVLADLPQGDGDPSLLFFPRDVSPNHHALAERFGLFDRFMTNAEVSAQGHVWSTAGYVTDYTEKTTPSLYSLRRADIEEGEVDEPARGFLWSHAARHGLEVRVYGEYAEAKPGPDGSVTYQSRKPSLAPFTSPTYPSFDMRIPDQKRADVWIADLHEFEKRGRMPALEILHLPADHTAGARPDRPTPRSCMADNDLALGRIVEALSRSAFWKTTVVFVLEDDAQAGPDHVDAHRAPLLVISPYNRPGLVHRFANTTDVLATLEEILGIEALSQFDHFGRPLREVFAAEPDLTPYEALTPSVPLTEMNPPQGPAAHESMRLDLRSPDAVDDALFNRVLWRAVKGETEPPPRRRLSTLDLLRR